MNSLIIAMCGFALVGAATPGPVNILATTTAVNRGSGEAVKLVIGASIAYALVVLLSGMMLHQLVELAPKLTSLLTWFGSLFLFYLAYQIYTAPVVELKQDVKLSSGWWIGSMTQILNPKAWLVAMSGVSLYVVSQGDPLDWLWVFTLVSLLCCLIGVGLWAAVGRALASYLSLPHRQRIFNRVMAITLAASVSMIWS